MEKSDMISVVIGSKSDSEVMLESCNVLKDFGLAYELRLFSFHRNPEEVLEFGRRAREQGIKVIIASIGTEKHLAGILASLTTLPVIGVPILSVDLDGTDALFSNYSGDKRSSGCHHVNRQGRRKECSFTSHRNISN